MAVKSRKSKSVADDGRQVTWILLMLVASPTPAHGNLEALMKASTDGDLHGLEMLFTPGAVVDVNEKDQVGSCGTFCASDKSPV